jgi:hypothetical protein
MKKAWCGFRSITRSRTSSLRASGILFRKVLLAVRVGQTRKLLECDRRPPIKSGETPPHGLSR